MSSDLRSVVLSGTYLVNGWRIRLSNALLIINVFSPGVYPFLSILALREIGPEVQNQQQSVLSFVPACGDWRKRKPDALANYLHIPHHNQWKWSIMMSTPLWSCRPCGYRSKPDYAFTLTLNRCWKSPRAASKRLTSNNGVLMSMCSKTVNSFLVFMGRSHGLWSSAFTQ